MTPEHNCYLVLPRMRIQNLNCISSPLTWGAPSITAVLGFMHALQRRIPEDWYLDLLSAGLVVHEFEPQVNGHFEKRFNLTRNPVDKDGKTQAIVEEGRAHALVSLVFGVCIDTDNTEQLQKYADQIYEKVSIMRFAGGSVLPNTHSWNKARFVHIGDSRDEFHPSVLGLVRQLLPGFALLGRDELLREHTKNLQVQDPAATELDALLDLSRLNYRSVVKPLEQDSLNPSTEEYEIEWRSSREEGDGWLVPIPVGFSALSELFDPGEVDQARDNSIPFRFVESVYSMGEWRSPHRLEKLSDLLWYSYTDHEAGLYRCINS